MAWGSNLYDAVSDDLRPLVLHLAEAAAVSRHKADAIWRLTDWLGRVELATWYEQAGLHRSAHLVRSAVGEITDQASFLANWPTGIQQHQMRQQLDQLVKQEQTEADTAFRYDVDGAAEDLAEMGLVALDEAGIPLRRRHFRFAIDAITHPDGDDGVSGTGPDKGDLWDLRALYGDILFGLARPATRVAGETVCELLGWDPGTPTPGDTHPLRRLGYPVVSEAATAAVTPYVCAAHLREMDAFRRTALGKQFLPTHP